MFLLLMKKFDLYIIKKLPKINPKSCENSLKIKDRKTIENHRILLDNNYTYAALV